MKCYKKDYPRTQFVREQWFNLNGQWNFSFDDENCGEHEQWFKAFKKQFDIQVPYTYETNLSGIEDETVHNFVWYHRTLEIDSEKLKDHRYVLHFEGSDYFTKLWVNGEYVGSHRGGYSRFSFDIAHLLNEGKNDVVVKVEDSLDQQQPRGKQRWRDENFGCWYVQTTGIWKTVWGEYVPLMSISRVKMTPVLEEGRLAVECFLDLNTETAPSELNLEVNISYDRKTVNRSIFDVKKKQMQLNLDVKSEQLPDVRWNVHTWSPQTPNLYDIEFRLIESGQVVDKVASYFAMRDIRIEGDRVLLNGSPLYQKLILDQGYWQRSHLTPPNEEALIEDLDRIYELGYNGLRKHQKIEDERFLYWCDVKGILVWSEAAATYEFSDDAVEKFTNEWIEIIKQNYNHPCIITWVPFNESWGLSEIYFNRQEQQFTEAIYNLTKSIDAMRPVIVNDGWEHTVSDIITLHDYEVGGETFKRRYTELKDAILDSKVRHNTEKTAFAKGYRYAGQPVMITEYGGIAFENDESGWGYGKKVQDEDEFIRRFESITMAIKELSYVSGYCYTQLTDVQQEINGLMDIERNYKVAPEKVREINERAAECLYEKM